MFFYKVEGHMPKLSSFGQGKTIRPKKSLTSFNLNLMSSILQVNLRFFKIMFIWRGIYTKFVKITLDDRQFIDILKIERFCHSICYL